MEPEYYVLLGGQKYGPANATVLNQWIAEGRIVYDTTLEEAGTGRQIPASQVSGLNFPQTAPQQAPGQPGGYTPGPTLQPNQPGQTYGGPGPQDPYSQTAQAMGGYYRPGFSPGFAPDPQLSSRVTLSLVLGIVSLLFCCIGGIVATVLGVNAQSAYKRGDYAGAENAAKQARIWAIVSFVVGILSWIGRIALIGQSLNR